MTVHDHIKNALDELGNTEKEVYRTIKKMNMLGNPDSFKSCPVALYLKNRLYKEKSISENIIVNLYVVGSSQVFVDDDTVEGLRVDIPKPVSKFINSFDDGKYPELQHDSSNYQRILQSLKDDPDHFVSID